MTDQRDRARARYNDTCALESILGIGDIAGRLLQFKCSAVNLRSVNLRLKAAVESALKTAVQKVVIQIEHDFSRDEAGNGTLPAALPGEEDESDCVSVGMSSIKHPPCTGCKVIYSPGVMHLVPAPNELCLLFRTINDLTAAQPCLTAARSITSWLCCPSAAELHLYLEPRYLQDVPTVLRYFPKAVSLQLANCPALDPASKSSEAPFYDAMHQLSTMKSLKQVNWVRRRWCKEVSVPGQDLTVNRFIPAPALQHTLALLSSVRSIVCLTLDLGMTNVGGDYDRENKLNQASINQCMQLRMLAALPCLEELRLITSFPSGTDYSLLDADRVDPVQVTTTIDTT
jgi:hypothetical protein